ncbi:MAG: Uma2 family endonuclease [Thermoanaerobaculia bacterium]
MEPQPKPYLTPEDYLAIERQAETRSEYLDGEMFAMTGGSLRHSLAVGNLVRELSLKLKNRPCRVFPSDLRVHIPATGLYTYPDVIVVCGEPLLQDECQDTLLNPTVIIEVLSPTTEAYDRGKKFEHYRSIESLLEYLLVSQSEPHVEHYLRQDGNRWLFTETTGLEATLALPSIQCELALAEIYDKIAFPLGAPASSPAD